MVEDQAPPLWVLIPMYAAIIGMFWGICWVVLRAWRGYHTSCDDALLKLFDTYRLAEHPVSGYVAVRYSTFVGAFFTVREQPWQFWVEGAEAKKLLGAMAEFNLKRGLLTGFAPYVLLLTFGNYIAQRLKIRSQLRAGT